MSLEYNPAEVQKAKNFISDLQGKISKIEEALHRLQSAKERVEARLAKQVSFIAPVNRLPSELLLVVFKLASDVYDLPAGYLLHEETQLSVVPFLTTFHLSDPMVSYVDPLIPTQ